MLGRPRREFSFHLAAPLFAAALGLALFAPGGAAAATASGALTPELTKLATPAVAARSVEAQAEAIGLPTEGPGSLSREGERVIVEARFEAGALARLEALKAAGAKILVASARYQTVALSVEPADLPAIAAVPGIASVAPSRRPVVYGAEGGATTAAATSNGLCEGGSVISQGLEQLNVPASRTAFGARGAGETIGVLSDSFDSATTSLEGGQIATTAAGDEVSNDLPGKASTCSGQQVPVRVIAEAPPPAEEEHLTDEGRAMLQVVHDLAPHAELAFATAYSSELEFARNIERLAEPVSVGGAGANVIVDDVGYFTEPFFQEGPVAVAIQKVTAAGVTYLTAAGNDNLKDVSGRDIGSWEAPEYKPVSCPSALTKLIGASAGCMNFSPTGTDSTFGIEVEPGGTAMIDLQWAEPWYGVKTDLDAYLLNSKGEVLSDYKEGEGTLDNIEIQKPIQLLGWENETKSAQDIYLVINRCSGTCNKAATAGTPRLKFSFVADGSGVTETEYPESKGEDVVGPTIYGHAGSPAAITLGAVRYTESATAPSEPERYSSRGPVTHYFGPVVGVTPAGELAEPEEIEKPNLTATDCASTTFFAQFEAGGWHFCGTSEAAPHAAAVAALMRQTDPGLATSPSTESSQIAAAMEASATKYTTVTSPTAVGAGLLNADAAMVALGGSPVDDPPSTVVAALEEASESETAPKEGVKKETTRSTPTSAPVVSVTKGPASLGNEDRPTFEFTSSIPATFTCQIDGGTPQPCVSPYVVPTALGDGAHGFAVTGTDAEGRSGTSGTYDFTIDTKAPRTTIVGHPSRVVTTGKRSVVAHFRLQANEAPVTFYCQIDREPLRICGQRFNHRFVPGRHVLKVSAKDELGNVSVTPTVFRFRVKELRPARSAR